MKLGVIFPLFLVFVACPPQPAPHGGDAETGPVDVGLPPATETCMTWCANLRAKGCEEGAAVNCLDRCDQVLADKIIDLKIKCISSAESADSVRKCKAAGVNCLNGRP